MDHRTICQQHSDVYPSKLVQMIPIKFHWFSILVVASGGSSLVAVRGLLIVVVSLVVEHEL